MGLFCPSLFCLLGAVAADDFVSKDPPRSSSIVPVGPVIGIVTQNAGEDIVGAVDAGQHRTYIAASYIKYIESAGGRVVPIHYDTPLSELTALFGRINGLLFPGGGMDLADLDGTYMTTVKHLWDLAASANKAGDYFPVWGTCLGFQTLAIAGAGFNASVLESDFDSEDLAIPLSLTGATGTSKLFGAAPSGLMQALEAKNITMNNHHSGIAPTVWAANPMLAQHYRVLSTNVDRKGRAFVSTMEAIDAPVYATQWHPEKAIFEWTAREHIPHIVDAVAAAQFTATFFVNECRKSAHRFDYDELNKAIIWNYTPEFTYLKGSNFEQCYFWSRP